MLSKVFPFIKWFDNYGLESLKIDAIAGLTVALVLIPQSMAYAQLAGLPAYYGLYAAFLPPVIAALFGSSRQLATGPVAVVSLMTSASLEPLATAGSDGYIAYAILLSIMVGGFQLSLGVLRLGLVVNFLSHPVVNGFTNAAAIIIASSQLSKMFGVFVDKAEHHFQTIINVAQAATHYTHWPTLAFGLLAFVIIYGLRILSPRIPGVLAAVVLCTILSWATGFENNQTVDISTINSDQVKSQINVFNETFRSMSPLSIKRTQANESLESAHKRHNALEEINAEHDVRLISTSMSQLKEGVHVIREKLRSFLFIGIPQPDGTIRFYLKNEVSADETGDNRTWRIRVGNKPITTDQILMMGGGDVVGIIPRGLPSLTIPKLDFSVMLQLFPYAAIISLLGFMEAISIAKAMAAKTGQRLDPNQELIGQGLGNIIGAIGKSYPASGSFSRSAVNLQAGAVTGLSSVFTSLTVVIVLLFFTPLLYYLPQAVLAAVIMMAVIGLVNVSGFIHAWRAQWYDGAISIITFIATLGFAPHLDKGIIIGVTLSLLVFLYKSMRPTMAYLARHDDEALRCAETHGLKECEYITMLRFDGPLFFANASYLEDKIMEIMRQKPKLKHIIIVANGINDIDASGEETMSQLVERVRSAGVDISLSGVNESVMKVFNRTYFPVKIGRDHLYPTMEKTINAIHEQAHQNAEEDNCPLLTVCPVI